MDIEKLKEARHIAGYTTVSKLTEIDWTALREISKDLIDEAIARQSVKSEDVAGAIEYFEDTLQFISGEPQEKDHRLAITALQAYQPKGE